MRSRFVEGADRLQIDSELVFNPECKSASITTTEGVARCPELELLDETCWLPRFRFAAFRGLIGVKPGTIGEGIS